MAVFEVVVDSSVWIDVLNEKPSADLEDVLARGVAVIPPIVVAELVAGASTVRHREALEELLQEIVVHETSLQHWIEVGDLRRRLKHAGVTVTVPDAHVAQTAIDRRALLLTRDAIFLKIAKHSALRLYS